MAKRKDDGHQGGGKGGHDEPSGPIESFEIVERPLSSRGRYEMGREARALMDTVGTGKAVRLNIGDQVDLHKIHMALRHAMKKENLSLHYKRIGDRTLLAWAEKATKALMVGMFIWTLYLLNPDGSLGKAILTGLQDKEACVAASYRVALQKGIETRCGVRGI